MRFCATLEAVIKMAETRNLLTINMAAEYLHCAPETVRRMLRRGELPGVKFGKFWRVPLEGLRQMETRALAGEATKGKTLQRDENEVENPLARALEMVRARDAALPARRMRTLGVNDAASEIRQMREEQTP
jgi:excisionase family DNA binding protein